MQQQMMQMQPMMAAYYPNNVTTDHIQQYLDENKSLIQQYLDENKSLILKIVESQSSGKLSECAENQSRLQRNLMYLAAIADSQPQPPAMPGQYTPGGVMQQGAHYMQAHQAQQMTQQQLMAARSSLLYSQHGYSALQQQQAMHNQLGMSSGASTGLHMLQGEATSVGGNAATIGSGGFPDFAGRGVGGKQQDIGSSAGGRGGSSGGGHVGEGGENLYLKSPDDGN